MKKQFATISADVIASTSLPYEDLKALILSLKYFLAFIEKRYTGFWGRIVRGDGVECVIDNPNDALRIALLLKSYVKSLDVKYNKDKESEIDKSRFEKFKQFGIRIAVGIGGMKIIDRELGILDGEAIHLSGRALTNMRSKPIDSFQIVMENSKDNSGIDVYMRLLNHVINEATSRQCKTLYYRLLSEKDQDVAEKMGISRAGVNNNLRCLGWDVIQCALAHFEQYDFQQVLLFNPSELVNEPLEEACLYRKIGYKYLRKGNTQKAFEAFEKAIQINWQELGPKHRKTAVSMIDLYKIELARGEYKKALAHAQRALDIYTWTSDDDDNDPNSGAVDIALNAATKCRTNSHQKNNVVKNKEALSKKGDRERYNIANIHPSALKGIILFQKQQESNKHVFNQNIKNIQIWNYLEENRNAIQLQRWGNLKHNPFSFELIKQIKHIPKSIIINYSTLREISESACTIPKETIAPQPIIIINKTIDKTLSSRMAQADIQKIIETENLKQKIRILTTNKKVILAKNIERKRKQSSTKGSDSSVDYHSKDKELFNEIV